MPELPEVETVRRQLAAVLPGRRIAGVRVRLARVLQNASPEELARRTAGRVFGPPGRRGKYLLLPLFRAGGASGSGPGARAGAEEAGARLIVHLRMTGRLTVEPAGEPETPYTRVAFSLDDGQELRFADVRTFGTIHLVEDGQEGGPAGLAALGPEPLADEFTPEVLAAALAGRRAPVKAVLLDQRRVAGLGNIYADEALFAAGIHPQRPAGGLARAEVERLHEAIRTVLARALAEGGTTFRDYVNGRGQPGGFQAYLQVYGRAGRPCPRCGAAIARLRVAGRGTHVCLTCQT
ncbi:MAG: bifunctional DNA-formamidopyrimidine glycosylase/DNA-(apurinic or apyrimidinic site) lyase [Limnochordales bacterium]|jgi:formamidopyrimidine-DNA glycosylase (fpg)|nr:MAG: DNA-formamidopyrimidine glycosylase [Bacillota bacterium]